MARLILTLLALALGGCDVSKPGEEVEGISLVPGTFGRVSNGNIELVLRDSALGWEVYLEPDDDVSSQAIWVATSNGIWMATDQDGFRANVATSRPGVNHFRLVPDSLATGYFLITSDSLRQPIDNWPTHLGAPTVEPRRPQLYGDRMAWVAFETDKSTHPANVDNFKIPGVRVGQTLFMFDSAPLNQAIFARFDITNTTTLPIPNLHLGFESDFDVIPFGLPCRTMAHTDNSSGYDLVRHFSYVYTRPLEDVDNPAECYGLVAGFSILDMESAGGLRQPKLAHRILRRHRSGEYADFSELYMRSDESILLGLNGYAYTGAPMIDPGSGAETKFAFTGDPVLATGWLDERSDMRALQSIAPFTLLGGETRTMTIAIVTARGSDLQDGLVKLKQSYDDVVSNPQMWDF